MSITFILVDYLPQDFTGSYVHYEHRFLGSSHGKFCDIREITHRYQDRWIAQIKDWHQELCRVGSEIHWQWWLLPASRVAFLVPIEFKPLFFALGVIEYVRSNTSNELYVVGAPEEVKQYLQEWCVQSEINCQRVLVDKRRLQHQIQFYHRIVHSMKPFLKVGFQLCGLIRKLFLPSTVSNLGKQSKILIFSLTLSADVIIKQGDHFFGTAFDDSESFLTEGGVQWLYYLTNFFDKDTINKYCYSIGRNVSFEFQWLHCMDVIKIIWSAVRLRIQYKNFHHKVPTFLIDNLKLPSFSQQFVLKAVYQYVPIIELSIYWAMKNCLKNVRPEVVVYPFEQKGLERAILRACAEHPCSPQTIAFAHAVYNKLHWYICDYTKIKQPMPDRIAVTGSVALSWMMTCTKWHESRFLLFGSPRAPLTAIEPSPQSHTRHLKVLMVVGYGYELEYLADWVNTQTDLFSECELMVRRYPYAWKKPQDRGVCKLLDLGVRVLKETGGLTEQIAWADVVIFCSTSAGVEAILRGKIVIRVNLDDVLNTDPTGGKLGSQVIPNCTGPVELQFILSQMVSNFSQYYASFFNEQRRFAKGIYSPVINQMLIE